MSGKLTKAHREKVNQFVMFTSANERCAVQILQKHNWNLELSVDVFFNNPPADAFAESSNEKVDKKAIEKLFSKYKDADVNSDGLEIIGASGLETLCKDLGEDPEGIGLLILGFMFDSKNLLEISDDEFSQGMKDHKCDSIEKLKNKLSREKKNILNSDRQFKDFYMFLFDYGKNENQKVIEKDTAMELMRLSLQGRLALLDEWLAYLSQHSSRAVTRDTWSLLLEFSKQVGKDLSSYDEEGAWPVVIDEFVEHLRGNKDED